jgi:hypothetical protein
VLPGVFVAIGAGAALAALVTAIPPLVWLSAILYGVALLSFIAGAIFAFVLPIVAH